MKGLELSRNASRTMMPALMVGVLLAWLVGATLGSSHSAVGANNHSPVLSATAPPSSYQRSLVQAPGPVDNSGNLLITGNVAGGKYFHGNVPYRSTTSIDAPLGSTTLDSFMRYTEPVDVARSPQDYSSFYSSTGTATTLAPARGFTAASFTPGAAASARPQGDTAADALRSSASALAALSAEADADLGQIGFSTGARFRRESLSAGLGETPVDGAELTASDPYREQSQELQRQLGRVQQDAFELQRSLTLEPDRSTEQVYVPQDRPPQVAQEFSEDGRLSRRQEILQETARLLSATIESPPETIRQNDVTTSDDVSNAEPRAGFRPGLRRYDPERDSNVTLSAALLTPRKHAGALVAADSDATRGDATDHSDDLPAVRRVEETARAFDAPSALLGHSATDRVAREEKSSLGDLKTPDAALTDRVTSLLRQLRADSGSDKATAPLEQVGSARQPTQPKDDKRPAFSQSACESHLQKGQSYLREGKHMRAAESFALASTYNPSDARAHLGRGQALFGAAEFIGSALSLAKAIELDPKRALLRVDLVWIAGGPEAFVERFNDLTERSEAGGAPQLQFLLAYVYYQMERPQEAKVAIAAARKDLPSSIAVDILSTAIGP